MFFSTPSLHTFLRATPADQSAVASKLASIALARTQIAPKVIAPAPASITIPFTTVSLASNFDASINIRFASAPYDMSTWLWVDSGNNTLIVPDYDSIAQLAGFDTSYEILAESVQEPWGCPAKILRGPIEFPMLSGGTFSIPGCVFYACTDVNTEGKRTANFGTGSVSPWPTEGNLTIQAPLSYNPTYPYAEFNYAPAASVLTGAIEPKVVEESSLTIHQSMPDGFQWFDIVKGIPWMSLIPHSLSIGASVTNWPGNNSSPIAMIDTGGGPVFLSDPNKCIGVTPWPEQVPCPTWTAEGSVSCQAVKDDLTIEIGDGNSSFKYNIDTSKLPASVQGLTLVMCENCSYMMGNQGMNIGGLSALFLDIAIDYSAGRIGLKIKQPMVT